ncbi:hypothetical protein Ato02nite_028500 [Paractinoplanes toevensis]|uniref:Uncharacterized protein n=1 Tax=Paractinoplanes toevensis TaxID=571911 RepID=A0A919T9A1_9ACTN|nr:hypothetical protein Ato02nite_028500 [Actinoplanes toevensis]
MPGRRAIGAGPGSSAQGDADEQAVEDGQADDQGQIHAATFQKIPHDLFNERRGRAVRGSSDRGRPCGTCHMDVTSLSNYSTKDWDVEKSDT